MIITQLTGGLGNQMFQYALARRLAYDRQCDVKLDLSYFRSQNNRRYQLGCFNICEVFATTPEVEKLSGRSSGRIGYLAFQFCEALKPYHKRRLQIERSYFRFDPHVLKAPLDVYLKGYWQNEGYFLSIEDILRKEFTFKQELMGKRREIAREIKTSISVGVHIRRGDFVSNPDIHRVHGVLGMDYYRACARQLAGQLSKPHFFVFSDDPEWVRENFSLSDHMTIVGHDMLSQDSEDLCLMSECQHFIIANSTFSWWAAWLSRNAEKRVFAPKRWFAVDDFETSDLYPAGWHVA